MTLMDNPIVLEITGLYIPSLAYSAEPVKLPVEQIGIYVRVQGLLRWPVSRNWLAFIV